MANIQIISTSSNTPVLDVTGIINQTIAEANKVDEKLYTASFNQYTSSVDILSSSYFLISESHVLLSNSVQQVSQSLYNLYQTVLPTPAVTYHPDSPYKPSLLWAGPEDLFLALPQNMKNDSNIKFEVIGT